MDDKIIKDNKILQPLKEINAVPESGYGSVTIGLKNGKITHIEKKESIQLSN